LRAPGGREPLHRTPPVRQTLTETPITGPYSDGQKVVSRYRSPEKPGSQFITPAGAARLKEELDELWKIERPRVTQAVSEAAAQGDRSENAEYTYGKKRLREIDRRVRFLRKRLDGMTVVDKAPSDRKRVYFGAWVEIEDEEGKQLRHRIVGPDEFDMAEGYISMDAPLARALMRKALDEEVRVELPGGARTYVITDISYE
jgi:transcription elongation factor GreB